MKTILKQFIENCNDKAVGIDTLCIEEGSTVRCVTDGVPENLQWLYGWVFTIDGRTRYTSGGITKRELVYQLLARRKIKPNAILQIKKQLFF